MSTRYTVESVNTTSSGVVVYRLGFVKGDGCTVPAGTVQVWPRGIGVWARTETDEPIPVGHAQYKNMRAAVADYLRDQQTSVTN